ncbi:hypothetical protein B0T21DRAFT_298125 [Apiosordaria backusii]|uniref:Uncharacterized protein n=1 Tax=Apiosordaria backusii TaxID=314023 RepID=A0AA40DRE1_9PEZI|nr:hypothetical protein B0T21DRAFT_298125 [Apiosordaria backusii]
MTSFPRHIDLWPGNVMYRLDKKSRIVFDANALWAHSELELGLFRNPRYPLGEVFLEECLKKVPISETKEDFDSRNITYMIRHQARKLAALVCYSFVANMKILVDRVNAEESGKKAIEGSKKTVEVDIPTVTEDLEVLVT